MDRLDTPALTRQALRGSRVLVTGGLGFIGSTLSIALVDAGAEVSVIDCLDPAHGGNRHNLAGYEANIDIHVADLRDSEQLVPLLRGCEYVFNLAGQSAHMESMRRPLGDLEHNARAQLVLLEACRDVAPDAKVVFASTRQVYGRPRALPVDESHPTTPVDVNGVHKLAAEMYHMVYASAYGMHCSVLRLTNTIGPRMYIRDARQTFLGVWIREVIRGQPFDVWGGSQQRDFTYVDDAVDALLRAATTDAAAGRTFNVGGVGPVSLLETAKLLRGLRPGVQFRVVPFPEEQRSIDIGDYFADDALFRSTTGWAPQVDLRTALERTLGYFEERASFYVD